MENVAETRGNPFIGFRGEDLAATAAGLAKEATQHPALLLEQQAELVREVIRVLAGQSENKPAAGDKRFADRGWTENPFYRVFLGGYLAWSNALEQYIDKTSFDERTKERARFVTGLLTSAFSPSNFLTNPAALRRMVETKGESLVHGLRNMMSDVFLNKGMPSQVDKKAFQVGKNLGMSEGSVVFRNEVLELIQYKPQSDRVYELPLLVVPPQINKFYVFDLSPNNSIFDFLMKGGLQVFTISWRNPTAKQRDWGFDKYVSAMIEAVEAAREISGAEKINVCGACVGAMTLSALLGYYAAGGETPVNAATHLVAVIDLEADSLLGLFATKDVINAAKAATARKGVLEGAEMGRIFAWLRPNDLVWNYWVNNYLMGNDPPAFDILYWNNDTTRLPAKFHNELLDACVENKFKRPGAMVVRGRPIDLSRVTLDSFFIAGITDHIVPWKGVYNNMLTYGGDKTMVLSAAGHIQSIINPPAAASKRQYLLNPNHPADAEEWLKGSQPVKGSWWGHWLEWLQQRSGQKVPAPAQLGSAAHPPLEKSPGTYVVEP